MSKYMLTTIDNPFNPFTQFDDWFGYDNLKGYNTCGLLARFVITSDDISPADQDSDIDDGIRSILRLNPLLFRVVDENNEPQILLE